MWVPFTQECFVPRLFWNWPSGFGEEKKKSLNVFSQFCCYIHLKKDVTLKVDLTWVLFTQECFVHWIVWNLLYGLGLFSLFCCYLPLAKCLSPLHQRVPCLVEIEPVVLNRVYWIPLKWAWPLIHSNSKTLVEIWLCHLVHINSDSKTWEDNELVKSLWQ